MLKLRDLALRPDLQLGPMLVSPSRRWVAGPGGDEHLEPRIMQVFLLLLDARGKVVTRADLFEQCWGGVIVGDDSLNRAIVKVRRTGASVAPGLFEIETIPRTGYRMTGEITRLHFGSTDRVEMARSSPVMSRRALVGGGVAAATTFGLWTALRSPDDPRAAALVAEAELILHHEFSERRLSAIPLLEQAVSLQPDNAAALGLLAYSRALAATAPGTAMNSGARDPDDPQLAAQAIDAALTADPRDPHARLGLLLFQRGGFDWGGTEEALQQILAGAPRNVLVLSWLVALYQAAGRIGLSWNLNERQIAIDPVSPSPQWRRALKHWIFGRTAEADHVINRLSQTWPRHPLIWNARFLILAFTGRPHAALDMIDDAATRPETITPARMAQWRPTLAALESPSPAVISEAREANLAAARQSPGQAAYAIMALAGIGEQDAAYQVAEGFLLSKGRIITRSPSDPQNMLVNDPGWRSTQWLSTPPLADFRADRRFKQLCDGIGLTAYWQQRRISPDYPNVRVGT